MYYRKTAPSIQYAWCMYCSNTMFLMQHSLSVYCKPALTLHDCGKLTPITQYSKSMYSRDTHLQCSKSALMVQLLWEVHTYNTSVRVHIVWKYMPWTQHSWFMYSGRLTLLTQNACVKVLCGTQNSKTAFTLHLLWETHIYIWEFMAHELCVFHAY